MSIQDFVCMYVSCFALIRFVIWYDSFTQILCKTFYLIYSVSFCITDVMVSYTSTNVPVKFMCMYWWNCGVWARQVAEICNAAMHKSCILWLSERETWGGSSNIMHFCNGQISSYVIQVFLCIFDIVISVLLQTK